MSPQSPQDQDITLTESQLEQAASDASAEPVEHKSHRALPSTRQSITEHPTRSSRDDRNVSDEVSQKADGELDQLTQKVNSSVDICYKNIPVIRHLL